MLISLSLFLFDETELRRSDEWPYWCGTEQGVGTDRSQVKVD